MFRLLVFLMLGIAVGLAAALYVSARDQLEADEAGAAAE